MSNCADDTIIFKTGQKQKTRRFLELSVYQLIILWVLYKYPKSYTAEVHETISGNVGESPVMRSVHSSLEYMRGKGLVKREPKETTRACRSGSTAKCIVQVYSLTPEGENAILDGEWALKQVRGFSV